MIQTLEQTEDAYKTFGLISSQAFQLAALATTDKSSGVIAKDFEAHPFVLSKLSSYARELGRVGANRTIAVLVEADDTMKSSPTSPWLLIERALMKIAQGK
jgi:DNA polymerase III delta subunit